MVKCLLRQPSGRPQLCSTRVACQSHSCATILSSPFQFLYYALCFILWSFLLHFCLLAFVLCFSVLIPCRFIFPEPFCCLHCLLLSVNLHLRDGRTDRRQESNLEHLSLKMWHLVAIILMNFLIINWPNFVYLLVDPGFKILPHLNFLWSIAVRSPHRMDAPDRHNGQRDKRTNEWADGRTKRRVSSSVRPSVS